MRYTKNLLWMISFVFGMFLLSNCDSMSFTGVITVEGQNDVVNHEEHKIAEEMNAVVSIDEKDLERQLPPDVIIENLDAPIAPMAEVPVADKPSVGTHCGTVQSENGEMVAANCIPVPPEEQQPPKSLTEEQPPKDLNEEEQPPKLLTEEQKKVEMQWLMDNKALQDGKKVKVCLAYTKSFHSQKGGNYHYCEKALFNVILNAEKAGVLDLRNEKIRYFDTSYNRRNLISGYDGTKFMVGGGYSKESAVKSRLETNQEYLALFPNNEYHIRSNDVPGVVFETEWKDGKVDIKLTCYNGTNCHNDYTLHIPAFIVGEVQISDGSTKYLRSSLLTSDAFSVDIKKGEAGTTKISTEIDAANFKLLDNPPEFGDYCYFIK